MFSLLVQIDQKQFDKILELIESGKKEGATLECGGGPGTGTASSSNPLSSLMSLTTCVLPKKR